MGFALETPSYQITYVTLYLLVQAHTHTLTDELHLSRSPLALSVLQNVAFSVTALALFLLPSANSFIMRVASQNPEILQTQSSSARSSAIFTHMILVSHHTHTYTHTHTFLGLCILQVMS